jgi:hypothetical protein
VRLQANERWEMAQYEYVGATMPPDESDDALRKVWQLFSALRHLQNKDQENNGVPSWSKVQERGVLNGGNYREIAEGRR